jgi:L-fuculose-phosphate aldolase
MEANICKAKQEMIEIGHRIWLRGYCAGNEGNHSMRIGTDRVLCTATGVSKGFLTPEMICLVDLKGRHLENGGKYKPSSEIKIHLEIYNKRDDIKSVVHSHPPHATAFALVGMPIPEGIHPEAEVFLGRVPFADFAMPSKMALAESITALIKEDTNSIIMGNHGVVCFSSTIEQAYFKLEILDSYCRVLLLTRSLGKPNLLTHAQMKELLEVKASFGGKDERLSCASNGCASGNSDAFFSSFEEPPSAVSEESGNDLNKIQPKLSGNIKPLVEEITDKILKSLSARQR